MLNLTSDRNGLMPIYQTLFPFFSLQLSDGTWHGGSGDETRGGSAGVRILYMYVMSSGDICYDNRFRRYGHTKLPMHYGTMKHGLLDY